MGKKGKAVDGDLKLVLAGADVKLSSLELIGGATLQAKVREAGGGAGIDAVLDLGPARVMVPGSVDKASLIAWT